MLREYEELSYQEIAAVLDCPPATVMSRLARVRSRLRELLPAGWTSPHPDDKEAGEANERAARDPATPKLKIVSPRKIQKTTCQFGGNILLA